MRTSLGSALLIGFSFPGTASAQVLNAVERGWYFEEGYRQLGNYYAGYCDFCFTGFGEYHNWFVFNLNSVTETITGATLVLTQPVSGYQSPDPTETYTLFDVSTPPSALIDGTGGVAAYEDLGTGTSYGSVVVSEEDEGTLVSIPLNASAVAALNAADGRFAIGGAVTTLDPYGQTWGSSFHPSNLSRLVLETAPAECFVVIGDGPGTTSFDPGMHEWSTYTDRVQDFYLVTMIDLPEFALPQPGQRKLRRTETDRAPKTPRDSLFTSPTGGAPGPPDRIPHWMLDGEFTVQIVMWNPAVFPDLPEQVSHGLHVQVRADGSVSAVPYGNGTIPVWCETDVNVTGDPVVRFPFQIPGL